MAHIFEIVTIESDYFEEIWQKLDCSFVSRHLRIFFICDRKLKKKKKDEKRKKKERNQGERDKQQNELHFFIFHILTTHWWTLWEK